MLRLIRKVCDLRDLHLHPVRHFMLADLALDLRIVPGFILQMIEALDIVKCLSPVHPVCPIRVVQKWNRFLGRHELNTLVMGRQEATAQAALLIG
jgi:hypothetical protein